MSFKRLISEVHRRSLWQVLGIYLVGAWIAYEVIHNLTEGLNLPEWFPALAIVLFIAGLPIVLATAFVQEGVRAPAGEDTTGAVAASAGGADRLLTWRNAIVGGALAFGLLGVGTAVWMFRYGGGPAGAEIVGKSVAVLPFANMSADEENEYFSDGITDDIITHLSKIADLKVISRTSIMRYKDTELSIREIGEELGVVTILEGGVRRSGERVRINAQLIDVETDHHLWAEIYDRELTDVFAIQSDVAQQIAGALRATLTEEEIQRIDRRPTENLEAYDYYLRANAHLTYAGYAGGAAREAVRFYERALELDPEMAMAWARLSRAHSGMYWSYLDHSPSRLALAREAFERAFEIEPGLPDAHVAAAFYYYYGSRDYQSGLAEFGAALSTEPNNVDALEGQGWIYRRLGRWDQAVDNLNRAAALDPQSSARLFTAGETFYYAGRYEEADRIILRALAINPRDSQAIRLRALLAASGSGDAAAARAFLDEALTIDPVGALPGTDDLQPWWLLRAVSRDDTRLLDRLTIEVFGSDSIDYFLAVGQLGTLAGDQVASRAAYETLAESLERRVAEQPEDDRYHGALGVAYAGLGRSAEAIAEARLATELLPLERDAMWGRAHIDNLALVYVMGGYHDEAIEQLEITLGLTGQVTPEWLRIDPAWDPLREDPRFIALLETGG